MLLAGEQTSPEHAGYALDGSATAPVGSVVPELVEDDAPLLAAGAG